MDDPSALQWLDVSFYQIDSIGDVRFVFTVRCAVHVGSRLIDRRPSARSRPATPQVIASFPNLKSLTLHANNISKITDLKKVAEHCQLKTFTYHGNPIEQKKHVRNYVIYSMPSLEKLNCSAVTKQDRVNAETWNRIYQDAKKRREPTMGDD